MSTIPLTGTGGYFTRQGAFIGEYNRVAALYGSALTTGFQSIWVQFASSDQAAVQDLPAAYQAYANTGQQYQNTLAADATTAILLQVSDNVSLVPYTVGQAVDLLDFQMAANNESVQRPTTTAAVAAGGTNLGDTTVCTSLTNQYGDPLDMIFGEVVTATVTQAPTPGTFAGQLTAVGEAAVAPTSALWPAGSGANTAVPLTDPASGGLATDGGFGDWEGTGNNTPTNWYIVNGDAGITVFRSAGGGVRTGTDAAQITSDGTQATQLGQNVTLAVNTVYAVTFQAKINTTTATGTFRIALTDDNGNVLADDAGTPLSYTRNVNGQIGTAYATFTAFFATPRQLPETVALRVGTSVAATSGRVITFDLVNIVAATQLYNGGPFAAAFAGADPSAVADYYTLTYTTTAGARSFVRGADRLFSFRQLGVYYRSSSSPTVPDSLVTN